VARGTGRGGERWGRRVLEAPEQGDHFRRARPAAVEPDPVAPCTRGEVQRERRAGKGSDTNCAHPSSFTTVTKCPTKHRPGRPGFLRRQPPTAAPTDRRMPLAASRYEDRASCPSIAVLHK
jgi:hypothetical protein